MTKANQTSGTDAASDAGSDRAERAERMRAYRDELRAYRVERQAEAETEARASLSKVHDVIVLIEESGIAPALEAARVQAAQHPGLASIIQNIASMIAILPNNTTSAEAKFIQDALADIAVGP